MQYCSPLDVYTTSVQFVTNGYKYKNIFPTLIFSSVYLNLIYIAPNQKSLLKPLYVGFRWLKPPKAREIKQIQSITLFRCYKKNSKKYSIHSSEASSCSLLNYSYSLRLLSAIFCYNNILVNAVVTSLRSLLFYKCYNESSNNRFQII